MAGPRVILGAPIYNRADHLPEALESILIQTFADFVVVLVDDASSDATPEIVTRYRAVDTRVHYVRNESRQGMIENWRRAFHHAHEQFPGADYFAWISDHDVWHPCWLKALVSALDAHPDVVLAYPLNLKIDATGATLPRKPWRFETMGVASVPGRLAATCWGMSAGNMVYGLFRIRALCRAGVFRSILVPDRFLLVELSLYGQFEQVKQVLWYRRSFGRVFSLRRQRLSFYPNGRPLYAYIPWWISHGAALGWLLGVRGTGRPLVGRAAGALLALQYFILAGALHAVQSVRQLRVSVNERVAVWQRQAGFKAKAIRAYKGVRRRMTDWRPSVNSLLKRATRWRKRTRHLLFEAYRRPMVGMLRALRRISVVREQLIPWLIREEIEQIPAGKQIGQVRRDLKRLSHQKDLILVGPWMSEVGFELLYWIPFLTWAAAEYKLPRERMVAVTRGGAAVWYGDLCARGVDIFDLFSVEDFRRLNEERWQEGGNQKQMEVTGLDQRIVAAAQVRLGVERVELLHPSLMYRLLRFYWYEKSAVSVLQKHTIYRRLPAVSGTAGLQLPDHYVAVRFYFRPSFPDTPSNRDFLNGLIERLARRHAVVLLNTGISLDDHEDFEPDPGVPVVRVHERMAPARNLELQSRVIAGAQAFVGTYGGLAYLGPFYGVPAVAFYSEPSQLVLAHLEVSRRLTRQLGTPLVMMDTREQALLDGLLDGRVARPDDAALVGATASRRYARDATTG
jgi:glycosyltransferase involved in cell wall biosynthesis